LGVYALSVLLSIRRDVLSGVYTPKNGGRQDRNRLLVRRVVCSVKNVHDFICIKSVLIHLKEVDSFYYESNFVASLSLWKMSFLTDFFKKPVQKKVKEKKQSQKNFYLK